MEAAIALEKLRKITRPVIDDIAAHDLVRQHFEFESINKLHALNSYDDANFFVSGTRHGHESEYVLKIHNGADSEDSYIPYLEAMNAVMNHLASAGIRVNQPVPNLRSELTTFVLLPVAKVCELNEVQTGL